MTTSEIVDAQSHHDQIRSRLYRSWDGICALPTDILARKDLIRLHANARMVWAKMDNEMIECRKRGRATANYLTLSDELIAYIKIIEREIFWQKLH